MVKTEEFEVSQLIYLYELNYEKEFRKWEKKMKKMGNKKPNPKHFHYDFKDCKKYLKKHIKKIRNSTDYYINNRIIPHSQMLNIFKCFPTEAKDWFYTKETDFYKPVIKTNGAVEEKEINMFKGFKHDYKPYKEFSEATQSAVEFMLNDYIKDSLCSNNDALYQYVIQWIANMIQGNKNISALVLKGTQGIGKSTVVDFLRDYVLGTAIYINSNNRPLATDFNYPLMGKLLVSFEELQGNNAFETKKVESQFKDYITNNITNYKKEHSTPLENVKNINNYITTSNDFGALKGDMGRRFCILDISTKHINNNDGFFTTLRQRCFNNTVGKAFFSYCRELDISKYDAQKDMPITNRKLEAQLIALTPVIEYIRSVYLFKKTPLQIKCYSLYKDYCDYCYDNRISVIKKKIYFYQQLEHYGLVKKRLNGQLVYNYSLDKLNDIAIKFKWDMKDDDDEDDVEGDDDIVEEKNKYLHKRIEELEKEIERLKAPTVEDPTTSIVQQLLSF